MKADLLFCGVATADLSSAQTWYEALLGRTADVLVTDDEAMWQVSDGGWLYLVRDPIRAGRALVTLAVAELDQAIAELVARGIDAPAIETIPGAGGKAPFVDPEGNTVTLVQVLGRDG